MIDRRGFIRSAAAAGVAAAAMPGCARADEILTCALPSSNKPVAWVPPVSSPVVNRISAFDPRYDWALLERAYVAMAALPKTDGRSLEAQREIHAWFCASCAGAPEVHEHWSFFVWHRAFLFFHERILGKLAGDASLRLPYWDWENPARRTVPDGYYHGSLLDEKRFLKQGQSVQRTLGSADQAWNYDLDLVPALVALAAPDFIGTATSGGSVENGPHGFIHASVGGYAPYDVPASDPGDMANLDTAARDPVFFAHHANLDRCWSSWERIPGHENPHDAGFHHLTFDFFDEHGTYVSIEASQLGPTTKYLGYGYDNVVVPPAATVRKIPLTRAPAPGAVEPPKPVDATTIARARHVTVGLRDLEVPGNGIVSVNVATTGGTLPLGALFITPHSSRPMNGPMNHKVNTQFSVTPAVVSALTQPGSTVTIANASVGGPPPVGGAAPGGPHPRTVSAPVQSAIPPAVAAAKFGSVTIGVPADGR